MVGQSQQLWMRNNGKITIPVDSDNKHYYYWYSLLRQLSYSNHISSFPGTVDSSIALAMDLHLLVAKVELEESRARLLTLLRVDELAALRHWFSFFLVGG